MSESTLARPFGLALGLHLGVGVTLVAASWLALGPIPPEPELRLVFETPLRVNLDIGGARPAPRREAPSPATAPRPLRQPNVTPDLPVVDVPSPEPPSDGPIDGDPSIGGVPGTDGDGTGPFGEGWGDGPPGDDVVPSDDGPIEVTGTMTAPRLVLKVSPDYPRVPLRMGLSGTVVLRAVIGPDGSVEEVAVVRSTSPLFVEAATEAVRRWRYTPALQSGKPVRVYFDAVVEFKIR